MGSCMSSSSRIDVANSLPAATVISVNGELRRHTVPVTVSQVLEMESQPVASPSKFFICNSDRLYYDEYITPLDLDYELQENQIYFILPVSKLQYKLSASDMAALAVKASLALQTSPSDAGKRPSSLLRRRSGKGKQSKYARISPLVEEYDSSNEKTVNQRVSPSMEKSTAAGAGAGLGVSRSGSVRKLQRYSSRRAKFVVRSFRIKLNTIYEGSVLNL